MTIDDLEKEGFKQVFFASHDKDFRGTIGVLVVKKSNVKYYCAKYSNGHYTEPVVIDKDLLRMAINEPN